MKNQNPAREKAVTPAIIAKVVVPRRRPDIVRRARLLEVLSRGEAGTVAIVRAPAGYGKTTLLGDLGHEASVDGCWLSLDEWDKDPAIFLQYLRLSLGMAADNRAFKRWDRIRRGPQVALEEIARLFLDHERET